VPQKRTGRKPKGENVPRLNQDVVTSELIDEKVLEATA